MKLTLTQDIVLTMQLTRFGCQAPSLFNTSTPSKETIILSTTSTTRRRIAFASAWTKRPACFSRLPVGQCWMTFP